MKDDCVVNRSYEGRGFSVEFVSVSIFADAALGPVGTCQAALPYAQGVKAPLRLRSFIVKARNGRYAPCDGARDDLLSPSGLASMTGPPVATTAMAASRASWNAGGLSYSSKSGQ